MGRSIRITRFSFVLGSLVAIALVVSPRPAAAQTKATNTWTGTAGDKKWETGGNWSQAHAPQANEDVVIPGNSGDITQNGAQKNVNSLEMKDSPINPGSRLSAGAYSTPVKITAKKQIRIGANNYVQGTAGIGVAPAGGDVVLKAGEGNGLGEPGDLTNDGVIQGGRGHDGTQGGSGGGVTVSGDDVFNNGHELGGDGGDSSGPNTAGGRGGPVTNTSRDTCKAGRKAGGVGGAGTAIQGGKGTTTTTAPTTVALAPGAFQSGSRVELASSAGGSIVLTSLVPGQINADDQVCIDGGALGTPIDLRGNPPGINVIVASPGGSLVIHGLVLLDPGVTLAGITEPDATLSPTPCATTTAVPVGGPWLIGLLAASLAVAGVVAARRRPARPGASLV